MGELLEIINQRPSRFLRRWAVVTVPSLVAATALWGYWGESSAEIGFCRDAGQIDGVWHDDRKDAVAQAFVDTELPYAAQASETVLATIDAYSVEWSAIREELCEQQDGELAASDLLVMHCMLDQRERLNTLLAVFEAADSTVVNRAIGATQAMAPASDCARLEQGVDALPSPPENEREAVADVRARIARSSALRSAGKFREALDLMESAAFEASELTYGPVRAEAKLELGRILAKLGESERAVTEMDEAAWVGVEADHKRVSAEAWIELTFLFAARMGDVDEAKRSQRAALALLSKLDGADDLKRKLLVYSGTLALVEERYEEAGDIYREVLANDPDEPSVQRATLLMNLGSVQARLGKPDEAVRYYQNAVGMFVQQFGQVHPRVAAGYYNLGVVLLERGLLDDALTQFQIAYRLEEQTLGGPHPRHAATAEAMAGTLFQMGKNDEAIVLLREAMSISAEVGSTPLAMQEEIRISLIMVLNAADRLDEAETELKRGRAALDGADTKVAGLEAMWMTVSAQLARARERYDEALATATRAVELAESSADIPPRARSAAISELAWAKAGLGQHDEAAALVKPLLASPYDEDDNPVTLAERAFQLAEHQAKAGRRAEARAAAKTAIEGYDEAALFDDVERIESWVDRL